jgi:hypothetical protein
MRRNAQLIIQLDTITGLVAQSRSDPDHEVGDGAADFACGERVCTSCRRASHEGRTLPREAAANGIQEFLQKVEGRKFHSYW